MYDALYARQSVEKEDSISIESQIEFCRYETRGNPYKIYADRGYSGKDTRRPAFEKMLKDVRHGKISRVIVYKLDRISRSILDFVNMMETFQSCHVEFISSTERFDTSSPIGRAMLHICIVFAQLERETIQKRVADSYHARLKRGLYMGGRIPYGFGKNSAVIDGIKSAMYVPVPEEAEQIQLMYTLYAKPGYSLNDIVKYFDTHNIRHLRGGAWNTSRISDILRNPIYVRADADIYTYFQEQGADIINPISDFSAFHACYLYSKNTSSARSQNSLAGKEVVLAPHEGIVSSRLWLACRNRCPASSHSSKNGCAENSWLSGTVRCGHCGRSLSIAKSNTRWHKYFICKTAQETGKKRCPGTGGTVYVTLLEQIVFSKIKQMLTKIGTLTLPEEDFYAEENSHKLLLLQIDQQIQELLSKLPQTDEIVTSYITRQINRLNSQKIELTEKLRYCRFRHPPHDTLFQDPVKLWEKAGFQKKQAVAAIFIQAIVICEGKITITWNF